MQGRKHAGRPGSGSSTTSEVPRWPGKQTLVETSYPARAARPAVPAGEVIQRQEVPGAPVAGAAFVDPLTILDNLTRIRGEIENVREAVDPDAGADSLTLPAIHTVRLRQLSAELEQLRLSIDAHQDTQVRGQLQAEHERTQDALVAAYQTLALYHADQTLQAWSNVSEEDPDGDQASQITQYREESGVGGDWCGMFVDAQYRAAGLHGALGKALNSTFHTEQFFLYSTGSSNWPEHMQPHGTGQMIGVKAYHAQRGSLRSWLVGSAIGDDIRPGDVVTLDWNNGGKPDHVAMVRSYTPGTGDQPGELITVDGNTYGARKPGTAPPKWDELGEADKTHGVTTSRYETEPVEGGESVEGDAGYRDMTVYGRGRMSLVDFEPDHVYYDSEYASKPAKSSGPPRGPLQSSATAINDSPFPIQRSETGAIATADPAAAFDAATRGAAAELPYRDEMQRHFRADFSSVRAYVGRDLTALGASAATRGDQVAFASGTPDRETVAHELTHVLQARQGRAPGGAAVSDPGDASEHEARATASEIAAGRSVTTAADDVAAAPTAEIHRQEDPDLTVHPEPGQGGGFRLDWDNFLDIPMTLPNRGGVDSIRELYEFALLRHLPVQLPDICSHYPIPPMDGGRTRSQERHDAVVTITGAIRLRMQHLLAAGAHESAEQIRIRLFTANQYAIVDALQVEYDAPEGAAKGRYEKASNGDTFCNVYAYDVVTAMGGYLPRVWWIQSALDAIEAGADPVGRAEYETRAPAENINGEIGVVTNIEPDYVVQQRADDLKVWMDDYGVPGNWWQKLDTAEDAQIAANHGQIVIILGQNGPVGGESGHVSVVLSESDPEAEPHPDRHYATETADGESVPLQSQAGRDNFSYNDTERAIGTAGRQTWWAGAESEFTDEADDSVGFYVYIGTLDREYAIQPPDLLGTTLPPPSRPPYRTAE